MVGTEDHPAPPKFCTIFREYHGLTHHDRVAVAKKGVEGVLGHQLSLVGRIHQLLRRRPLDVFTPQHFFR